MAKTAFSEWKKAVSELLTGAEDYLRREGYETDSGALTVLLCDDAAVTALNRDFRGKDKPTNVLSFPSDEKGYLGDIAISLPTCEREAVTRQKPLPHHMAHLVVHGYLHLLGFDHEDDGEAEEMEALETAILAARHIPDPYC